MKLIKILKQMAKATEEKDEPAFMKLNEDFELIYQKETRGELPISKNYQDLDNCRQSYLFAIKWPGMYKSAMREAKERHKKIIKGN